MRALVTGITGFVGSHLARRLAQDGWQVAGLATGPAPAELAAFEVRQVDVEDAAGLVRVVDELDPEVIFHLAGLAGVGASWERPGDYVRINFGGTRHLIAAAPGRRIVFASSAEVYGRVKEEEQPLEESRPIQPRSPYAVTKACAELLVAESGGIVVRSFNSIGRGQNRGFALPSFAWQLAQIKLGRQQQPLTTGGLSPRRDFLSIDDAVEGYRLLAEKGVPGEAYNLASGRAVAIGEALELLRAISGVDTAVSSKVVREDDIPLLRGHNGKIGALGWRPRKTLEQALEEVWLSTLEAALAEEAAEKQQ